VRRGWSWAALTFKRNFTKALIRRSSLSISTSITDKTIEDGSLHMALDQSGEEKQKDVKDPTQPDPNKPKNLRQINIP